MAHIMIAIDGEHYAEPAESLATDRSQPTPMRAVAWRGETRRSAAPTLRRRPHIPRNREGPALDPRELRVGVLVQRRPYKTPCLARRGHER